MSTRDEILQAFQRVEAALGLTLREVLPYCHSCEGDEQIVGNTLAQLVKEGVLTREGFRAGRNIFRLADQAAQPLVDKPLRPAHSRAGGRPPKGNSTLEGRILEALRKKSPLSAAQLASHARAGVSSVYATLSVMRKKGSAIPVSGRRGVWQLPEMQDAPTLPSVMAQIVELHNRAKTVNGERVMGAIEKGVPIPSPHRRRGDVVARLRQLQVGDSFFTTIPHATFAKSAKRLGIPITRRREGNGFRIWRTA